MLIIIEGPDCAGKSYLVNQLRQRLNPDSTVRHASIPTAHPLDEYELPLLSYRPTVSPHIICDRWHLGEFVYPRLLGRPTRLDDATFAHIELFLASRGAVLVLLTPDETHVRDCLRSRGDATADPLRVTETLGLFADAAMRTMLPLIWLKDWTDPDIENYIVAEATDREEVARHLNRFVTYVGSPTPQFLLLGDVRNTGRSRHDLRPAFMPYSATSGHYLLSSFTPRDSSMVGLANACDVDDATNLWDVLHRPTVVALGRKAEEAAPWATRSVPHPQYWRRFRHRESRHYRELIFNIEGESGGDYIAQSAG